MKVSANTLSHSYHLITVCAWCKTHSKNAASLKKNEVYSHGICDKHREMVIQKVYSSKKYGVIR